MLAAPCGLCGVNPQAQYASGNTGYPAWLEKKQKTQKPRHECRLVGKLDYSHVSAAKFSNGAPSTNHLVACPECPARPMAIYFWKYRGMADYWSRTHPTITMPPALGELLKITDAEREQLKKFKVSGGLAKSKKTQRIYKAAVEGSATNHKRTREAAAVYIAGDD